MTASAGLLAPGAGRGARLGIGAVAGVCAGVVGDAAREHRELSVGLDPGVIENARAGVLEWLDRGEETGDADRATDHCRAQFGVAGGEEFSARHASGASEQPRGLDDAVRVASLAAGEHPDQIDGAGAAVLLGDLVIAHRSGALEHLHGCLDLKSFDPLLDAPRCLEQGRNLVIGQVRNHLALERLIARLSERPFQVFELSDDGVHTLY